MPFLSAPCRWIVILTASSIPALADPPVPETNVLDLQLDGLESRVLQRQDRRLQTRDLITDQDRRIAEQQVRTLKTRSPNNVIIPPIERQLGRIRKSAGRRDR